MDLNKRCLSSIALKWVVAVTGLIMVAFVAFHLTNNLRIYLGQEIYNRDGFAWKTPVVITIARPVLLISFVLHIVATVAVTRRNRQSGPQYAAGYRFHTATWWGRFMVVSGVITGLFVLTHVIHAKVGWIDAELHTWIDPWGRKDVYNMVILGLRTPWLGAAYALGLSGLLFHMGHGVHSALASLSLSRARLARRLQIGLWILLGAIYAGYISIPIAAWVGWLEPTLSR